jgi:hypothetical protein
MFFNSVNIKVALVYFLANIFKIDHIIFNKIGYFPMWTTLQGIHIFMIGFFY